MSLEIENKATSSVDNKNENKTQIDVSKFINTNVNQELKGKKLDSHDESLKQNLNDLIQKLNLNELRADLINQNGEESVSLKDETWNVYCKLRSFYSFEVINIVNLKNIFVFLFQISVCCRMKSYNG